MFWKSPQILRDPLFFFYYIQFDVSKTLYLGNDSMVLYLQVVDPVGVANGKIRDSPRRRDPS